MKYELVRPPRTETPPEECGRRGLIVFVSSQSRERPRSHRIDPRGVLAAIAPARLPSHSSDGAVSHLVAVTVGAEPARPESSPRGRPPPGSRARSAGAH